MRQLLRTLKRLVGWAGWMRDGRLSPDTLRQLARQLQQTQEIEYACEEVLRLLDQFAEAVVRGEDAARLMPLVQHHLELCSDCREEFEALLRILRAAPA